jgi:hypothetical protein
MAPRGEQTAQAVRDELACPQCEYSLRGLHGAVIKCPECGLECDIAMMIARRWCGPWTQAPGYSDLLRPVAVAAIAPLIVLLVFIHDRHSVRSGGVVGGVAILSAAILWAALLLRSERLLPNIHAIRLSLAAHALLAGYLAGIAGIVWSAVWAATAGSPAAVMMGAFAILCLGALLVACRRGERVIAERCIRQYLLRRPQPTGDTIAA